MTESEIELELRELRSRVETLEEEVRQSKLSNNDQLEELVRDWLTKTATTYNYQLAFDRKSENLACPEENNYSTTLTIYLNYYTTSKKKLSTEDRWKIERQVHEDVSKLYPACRNNISWRVEIKQVSKSGKIL